jgi:hypothetical protein
MTDYINCTMTDLLNKAQITESMWAPGFGTNNYSKYPNVSDRSSLCDARTVALIAEAVMM